MAITTQSDKPVKRQARDSGPLTYPRGDTYSGIYLSFDGVNDYIDFGATSVSLMSFCIWVNPTSTTEKIADFDGGTHVLELVAGVVTATGFSTPTIYVDGYVNSTITAGQWVMITVTTATAISVSNFDIGRETATYFTGGLSNAMMFSNVLNATEVINLWHDPGRLPSTLLLTDCIGWWPMNENQDAIGFTLDYSSNAINNSGVISGATYTASAPKPVLQNLSLPGFYADYFDGTNDNVSNATITADFDITGYYEMTLIFYMSGTNDIVFSSTVSSTNKLIITSDGTNFLVGLYKGSNVIKSTTSFTIGELYTLTCTIDRSTVTAFLNGVEMVGTAGSLATSNTVSTVIGANTTPAGFFTGVLISVEQTDTHKWTMFNNWTDEIGTDDMTVNGTPGKFLLTQGTKVLKDPFTETVLPNPGTYGVFNGDEYIRIPDNATLDITAAAITVAGWVYVDAIAAVETVLDRSLGYVLHVTAAGKVLFGFYQTTLKSVTGATTLVAKTWYYLSGTYDGTDTKAYVNGVEDVTSAANTGVIDSVSEPNLIGRDKAGSFDFNGFLDEVKVYNTALTAQQLLQNYRAGLSDHT